MIITDEFAHSYADKEIDWGFNGLGYVVFKRCVDKDTPVLCDDLQWRSAGDLQVGQGIVGFDAEAELVYRTHKRKVKLGRVMYNKIEKADTVGIELEDGTVLYSTPDHEWLTKHDSTKTDIMWREAKDLGKTKKGSDIFLLRPFGSPWATDNTYDGGFLSAAYDGEGSLDRTNEIQFAQVDNPMMDKVKKILSNRGIGFREHLKTKSKLSNKDCFALRTVGFKNTVRFLGEFQPPRLLEKFKENLDKKPKDLRCAPEDYVRVVRVFDAGERDIAVLSTDLETHFTGGFASHNTYARIVEGEDRTEEWHETIQRVINGAQSLGAGYTDAEAERLYDYFFNLKGSFAGRGLWQLGTELVDKFGADSLVNCWHSDISNINDFCFIFNRLMLGGGVGFSVKRSSVYSLPPVKCDVSIEHENTKDADFIVPDSREGWSKLLYNVFDSFMNTGESFTYSTILVRGAGAPINTFGGVASGPQILVNGVADIIEILKSRERKVLRSVDVLDIANIIGRIVVSGNVRRSAQIAVGDPDDMLFLRAKNWDDGNIPGWRAMSNNTIQADSFDHILPQFWDNYLGGSEPYGLFNLNSSRLYGRMGEINPDLSADGLNPCAEIVLADKECCNLGEVFLPRIESYEEFVDVSKLIYKAQKAVAAGSYLDPQTEEIVHKNMRLGLSVSGLQQAREKWGWLDDAYVELRDFDEKWSEYNGWNTSIRLTTIKPSGTLSLLAGVTPGIHPGFSQYHIRRVRMSSADPMVEYCRGLGYKTEFVRDFNGEEDHDTTIIEFPASFPDGTIMADEMSAIEQLNDVKEIQAVWADNSISCTVYYAISELAEIKEWLSENYDCIKSISFLLREDHGFQQAPLEAISFSDFTGRELELQGIEQYSRNTFTDDLMDECDTGACPVR